MITYRKNVQDHYSRAATVAHARAVTQKPSTSSMLAFSLLTVGGALATFALVWSIV